LHDTTEYGMLESWFKIRFQFC